MSGAKKPVSFTKHVENVAARQGPACAFDELAGIRVARVENGRVQLSVDVGAHHHNPAGVLHGGILSGLVDSAMAYALSTVIKPDESVTNLDLTVRFLKATVKDTLRAEARVVRAGRTVCVMECDVTNAAGELVAKASSTFLRLGAQSGRGWLPSTPKANPARPPTRARPRKS